MSISDQDFREAFKPLHIPAHYMAEDTDDNKIVYALAQIGQGTAGDVAAELHDLDASNDVSRFAVLAASVLNNLFEKGLIKGSNIEGEMQYNLSKITEANDGAVDPDLLAPGLD